MRGLNMAPNATVSPEVELADGIEDIGDAAVGIADKIGRSGDGAMEAMPVGQPAGAAAETLDTPETTAADFPRAEGAVPAAVLGPRQRFWGPPWLEAVLQKGWEKPCPRHPQPKNSLPKRLFCLDCAGLRGCERPVCDGCFDKKHNAHKTIEVSATVMKCPGANSGRYLGWSICQLLGGTFLCKRSVQSSLRSDRFHL